MGPALFNISINDMDSGIDCTHSKSASDTKLSDIASTPEGWDITQRDLDKCKKWGSTVANERFWIKAISVQYRPLNEEIESRSV